MKIERFEKDWFKDSRSLQKVHDKFAFGKLTIVGGSKLFHGAPLIALKGASRIVGMVYFSSPIKDKSLAEKIKVNLLNFIWIPRKEIGEYIANSNVVLIGPGMMRNRREKDGFVCDEEGAKTKDLSLKLFADFPDKKWVVDGGTLQVIKVDDLPKGAVVTPNRKEFQMLFGEPMEEDRDKRAEQILRLAKKHKITILTKAEVSMVSDGVRVVEVLGGNDGLVKGATGDAIAGLVAGFLAQDEPVFAAAAASYLIKKAAERLAEKRGLMFNADDLVETVPLVYGEIAK